MKNTLLLSGLAAGFWFLLFFPLTASIFSFWPSLMVASGLLATLAVVCDRTGMRSRLAFRPRLITVGVGATVLFYLIFLVGEIVSRELFPAAPDQVAAIYARKGETSPVLIGLALLFWIGPAEEIFWRGFIQHRLMARVGAVRGTLIGAALYAGVHAWSLNPMLCLAALLCGLFWGGIYLRYRSLWPGIISHALWDALVFVVLPLS